MMINRAVLLIGGVAFLLNFPFGMLRSRMRKYSIGWLLCIHLPIIPLILLRIIEGLTYKAIPYTLAVSVLGQFLGGRAGRWWFSS